MAELYLHGNKVESVFQLLGEHENDITYSVAWAMSKCPTFMEIFLQSHIKGHFNAEEVVIRLQRHDNPSGLDGSRGFTDIEIESPGRFFIIIEAKKGWTLPAKSQLDKYARRQSFIRSAAPEKLVIAMSECTSDYVAANFKVKAVSGIPVVHISYKEMANLAIKARLPGSHEEKHLLRELLVYLGGLMTMTKINSNWVYCVALAGGKAEKWAISWKDIVEKRGLYFHPIGGGPGGWPVEPPNYIAFRYNGKLQGIYHIESYEVITDLHKKIREIPSKKRDPHFLYKLGPRFGPSNEVKNGKLWPNGRYWCMLDTLFTSSTISDARDASQEREKLSDVV